MRKAIITIIITLLLVVSLAGCNYRGYDFVDTNYHFNRAIIEIPGGEIIEVEVAKWADAGGEQLTITDKAGNRYLVHTENCVLIEDGEG